MSPPFVTKAEREAALTPNQARARLHTHTHTHAHHLIGKGCHVASNLQSPLQTPRGGAPDPPPPRPPPPPSLNKNIWPGKISVQRWASPLGPIMLVIFRKIKQKEQQKSKQQWKKIQDGRRYYQNAKPLHPTPPNPAPRDLAPPRHSESMDLA